MEKRKYGKRTDTEVKQSLERQYQNLSAQQKEGYRSKMFSEHPKRLAWAAVTSWHLLGAFL